MKRMAAIYIAFFCQCMKRSDFTFNCFNKLNLSLDNGWTMNDTSLKVPIAKFNYSFKDSIIAVDNIQLKGVYVKVEEGSFRELFDGSYLNDSNVINEIKNGFGIKSLDYIEFKLFQFNQSIYNEGIFTGYAILEIGNRKYLFVGNNIFSVECIK